MPFYGPAQRQFGVQQSASPQVEGEEIEGQEEDEDTPLIDGDDLALFAFRGAEGATRDLYGLVDTLVGDVLPDAPDRRLFGKSNTAGGALLTGLSQFAAGYIATGGALAWGAKALQGAKFANAAKAFQAVANPQASSGLARIGLEGVKGSITDVAFFSGSEGRLVDTIKDTPLHLPVVEFLQTEEDDTEIEGRIKNAIEGFGLGIAVESIFAGIKGLRKWNQSRAAGKSPEESARLAREEAIRTKRAEDRERLLNSHTVGDGSKIDPNTLDDATPRPVDPNSPSSLSREERKAQTQARKGLKDLADVESELARIDSARAGLDLITGELGYLKGLGGDATERALRSVQTDNPIHPIENTRQRKGGSSCQL